MSIITSAHFRDSASSNIADDFYLNLPIIYSSGGCIELGGRSCAVR